MNQELTKGTRVLLEGKYPAVCTCYLPEYPKLPKGSELSYEFRASRPFPQASFRLNSGTLVWAGPEDFQAGNIKVVTPISRGTLWR